MSCCVLLNCLLTICLRANSVGSQVVVDTFSC